MKLQAECNPVKKLRSATSLSVEQSIFPTLDISILEIIGNDSTFGKLTHFDMEIGLKEENILPSLNRENSEIDIDMEENVLLSSERENSEIDIDIEGELLDFQREIDIQ